jgi:hypothetical protein
VAAGTECLSRLDEGEEHRELPAADADDRSVAIRPAAAESAAPVRTAHSPEVEAELALAAPVPAAPAAPKAELPALQLSEREQPVLSFVLLRPEAQR